VTRTRLAIVLWVLTAMLLAGCVATPPFASTAGNSPWGGGDRNGLASKVPTMVLSPLGSPVFGRVDSPLVATASTADTAKVGVGKCVNILGLFALGDASIRSAAKQAGIETIHHVDVESFRVLFLYARYEVRVYGE
jgi:hypothetical protein